MVYDNKVVGTEFDDIQMAYCCSMASVYRGSGQYWFLGSRTGTTLSFRFNDTFAVTRLMARRIELMECDLMLNSNKNEFAPAGWIHVLAGEVWHGRK